MKLEISGMHKEERELGESNTHKIYLSQEKQRKQQVTNFMSLCQWMVRQGEIGMVKGYKFIKAIKFRKLWRVRIAYVLKNMEQKRMSYYLK